MLSTLANMRANARVLDASLDAISAHLPEQQLAELTAKSTPGPLAYAVAQIPCLKPPEGSRGAAWCHATVLDADEGFWALASAIEGGSLVLVAMRGALSQQSLRLQRMCFYRMRMPSDLFDALPQRYSLRQSLLPNPLQDSLSMAERLEKMKEASARMDRWYHTQDSPIESTFTPDVIVIRHVTDFVTGAQSTRCFTVEDLSKQTPYWFGGERSMHVLAETHVPQQYFSMMQCYEVTRDSSGQPWRQSSVRVRVFDPQHNYKLKMGLILYSERDKFPNAQLPQNGSIMKGASGCLAPLHARQRSVMAQPHRVSPSPHPSPAVPPVKRARVPDAGAVEGKA
eukprot:jgi/Ulvmu1/291/UM001_0295.1